MIPLRCDTLYMYSVKGTGSGKTFESPRGAVRMSEKRRNCANLAAIRVDARENVVPISSASLIKCVACKWKTKKKKGEATTLARRGMCAWGQSFISEVAVVVNNSVSGYR